MCIRDSALSTCFASTLSLIILGGVLPVLGRPDSEDTRLFGNLLLSLEAAFFLLKALPVALTWRILLALPATDGGIVCMYVAYQIPCSKIKKIFSYSPKKYDFVVASSQAQKYLIGTCIIPITFC